VDNGARGSDVPAGIDRGADAVAPSGSRERGRLRRRLRELSRLREAQLLELGALALEAHRHGRDLSPVVEAKIAEAAATDREVRAIADALDTDAGIHTIVVPGIAGPCPTCGTLVSMSARFCSACATPLDGRPDAAPRAGSADAPETPLVDAREADPDDRPAPDAHAKPDANANAVDAQNLEARDPGARPSDAPATQLRSANGHATNREEIEATTGPDA
jgi:hypothetical protein